MPGQHVTEVWLKPATIPDLYVYYNCGMHVLEVSSHIMKG